MKEQEKRNTDKKKDKKESELVTKESFCAVFALFSFIALLILFTRSLIFGEVGATVHSFLTGVFGYCAYPLLLGALYLSIAGLFGFTLVKNRKAAWGIAFALLSVALVVHTAITYSWELEGYIGKCFYAGESFPDATVTGWIGALVVFAVASLLSKVGALVLFSVLILFFTYLTIIFTRKGVEPKKQKEESVPSAYTGQAVYQQPVSIAPVIEPQKEVPTQPLNTAYNQARMDQRPGVSLSENPTRTTENVQGNGAFSPFGAPRTTQDERSDWLENSYKNSREFLFGASPAENYKRNLIFDPNANVNKRPPVEPQQPSFVNSEYTPSYSDSYQNSVNGDREEPVKIFTDNVKGSLYNEPQPAQNNYNYAQEQSYNQEPVYNPSLEKSSLSGISPLQPIEEEKPLPQEPVSYPPISEERKEYLDPISPFDQVEQKQESSPMQTEDTGYRRHEYMDLFSPSNPNLFGNAEETPSDETTDYAKSRGEDYNESRNFGFDTSSREDYKEENERGRRDGFRLFDEEEEDPYTLRSEFENRRGGAEEVSFSDRSFSRVEDSSGREETTEPIELNTRGGDRFEIPERGRDRIFDEETTIAPAPVSTPKPPRIPKPYKRVSLDDFDCRDIEPTLNMVEVEDTKANIIATLEDFKVTGASIASVTFGPTVTRYNVTLPRSISPKKVVALDQSIAISLHSSGVNVYPNYEDGVVSIEVPNKERQFVQLGCMLSGDTFVNSKPGSLMFAMGKDVANRKVYGDISKMIHLLVAGSSGSGKSVFLGALIISLIYKYSPEELRLILIDPKKTEFVLYNNLPHLMINEIITEVNKAVQSLEWAINEMNRRYKLFETMSLQGTYVVNLDQYNAQVDKTEKLPKIVIIIDELADLMLAAKKDIEDRIQNLTQKARAAGIHLIVATQRPSTDVITGVIKSNLATRIAFMVATDVDSRVILDQSGAQKLLGKGDFLYTMQGINTPVRVQSAFISPEDSQRVVNYIKANNEAYYDEEATAFINNSKSGSSADGSMRMSSESIEPVYIEALRHVILNNTASISMIQRKCGTGYNKAGKIVEWMEEQGYISSFEGAKARKVLITKEEFERKYGPL